MRSWLPLAVGVVLLALALPLVVRTAARADAMPNDLDKILSLLPVPALGERFKGGIGWCLDDAHYLDDAKQPLDITQVTDPKEAHAFRPLVDTCPTGTLGSGWIRFSVHSRGEASKWILFTSADQADLYVPDRAGRFRLIRFGGLVPFYQRPYRQIVWPSVPLPQAFARGTPAYVHTSGPLSVLIAPETMLLAVNQHMLTDVFFWMGLYVAVGLSNLLLYLYLRERTFLLYAGVMLGWVVLQAVNSLTAWYWLWPSASIRPFTAVSIALAWISVITALFVRSLLQLPTSASTVFRGILRAGCKQDRAARFEGKPSASASFRALDCYASPVEVFSTHC